MLYDVKCIESDSHSAIYTVFVLGTINTMVNLKQFNHIVLIYVETTWPYCGFAVAVLGCRITCASNNNNIRHNPQIAINKMASILLDSTICRQV